MELVFLLGSFLIDVTFLVLVSCEGKMERLDLNCLQNSISAGLGIVLDSSVTGTHG